MAIVKISDLPLVDSPVEGTDLFVVVQDNVTKKAYASDIQTYVGFEEVQYATAGQTVFNLTTMTYAAGANNLMVFVDGVNQYEGLAYQETDNNTVTFTQGLHVGAVVKFSTVQTQTSLVNSAGAVTFTAAGAGAIPRSVQSKERDIVSVKDFGAVGDGVTDDTNAIQNAITAVNANGGGILQLGAGTFLITSTLNMASNVQLVGSGIGVTIIKMDAASTSDNVIFGNGLSDVRIANLSVDVNGIARSANPNPMTGIRIQISTNVIYDTIEVYGSLGSLSASAVGAALAQVTRGLIVNSTARDCGSLTRGSDGFYCGPNEQTLIQGCIADNCTDTAFVLESCNYSGIVGCTSKGCRQGGAISVAFAADCFGNFINGLTVYNWSSAVAGGIPIATYGTGKLLFTQISNVTMIREAGLGPAIRVYNDSVSTATIESISFSNVMVVGAGTQGILVQGKSGRPTKNVTITGCRIYGSLGGNGIQVEENCSDVQVAGCFLAFTATTSSVGVYFNNALRASVENCRIQGDGATMTYGVYFDGTNTNSSVLSSTITGTTVLLVGAVAIGTIQQSLWINDGSTGRLQIGANTVLRERLSAVSTVSGTAGGTYTSTEQNMINDLKTAVNAIIARLNSSTGHGLIT